MRAPRLLVAAVITSLALGACQSALPTGSPTPAATVAAAPSPTLLPIPTAPPDVTALFAAQAGSLKSGVVTFDGTATVGLVQIMFAGTSTYTGVDSRAHTTTTVAGVPTTVEAVQVAGKRYAKNGDGPWLEVQIVASGDLSGSLQKSALGALTDAGTEQRGGQTVHKLVPRANAGFDPAVILGTLAGAESMQAQLAFYATEAGLPVAATVEATWKQTAGEASVDAMLSFEMAFSQVGMPQTIRVPDDVWVSFVSSRFHLSFAYPSDFEYESQKDVEKFWSPAFGGIPVTREPASGASLGVWAKELVAAYKKELGGSKSSANAAYKLAGVTARLLTVTGENDGGDKVLIYSVVAIKGKYAYVLSWIALAGNEAADLARFEQFLSTVAFT